MDTDILIGQWSKSNLCSNSTKTTSDVVPDNVIVGLEIEDERASSSKVVDGGGTMLKDSAVHLSAEEHEVIDESKDMIYLKLVASFDALDGCVHVHVLADVTDSGYIGSGTTRLYRAINEGVHSHELLRVERRPTILRKRNVSTHEVRRDQVQNIQETRATIGDVRARIRESAERATSEPAKDGKDKRVRSDVFVSIQCGMHTSCGVT
jgi:hypothetical protein